MGNAGKLPDAAWNEPSLLVFDRVAKTGETLEGFAKTLLADPK